MPHLLTSVFGTKRTYRHVRFSVAIGGKTDVEPKAPKGRGILFRPRVRVQPRCPAHLFRLDLADSLLKGNLLLRNVRIC